MTGRNLMDVLDRERLSGRAQLISKRILDAVMRQSALPYKSEEMKGERGDRRISSACKALTPNESYILGYFLGDGSLGDYTMRAKSEDKDIIEHLAKCIKERFKHYCN